MVRRRAALGRPTLPAQLNMARARGTDSQTSRTDRRARPENAHRGHPHAHRSPWIPNARSVGHPKSEDGRRCVGPRASLEYLVRSGPEAVPPLSSQSVSPPSAHQRRVSNLVSTTERGGSESKDAKLEARDRRRAGARGVAWLAKEPCQPILTERCQ
jgi:hypothetical protein